MNTAHSDVRTPAVHRPLAAALALALSVGASAPSIGSATAGKPHAPTVTVTNCDDNGAGSLRAAVAGASTGDTIDLTTLACSTITLTTGYIAVTQDDLTLTGPGAAALTIDAGGASGVVRHSGSGVLSISGLTVTNGDYQSAATPRGGCIYSAANLSLVDVTASNCAAVATAAEPARGGGIYTVGDLSLTSSTVTQSHAHGMSTGAHGGGIYVAGNLTAYYSTISYNNAYGAPINGGSGGGAMIYGTTLLKSSTVAYNGSYAVGGLYTQDEVTVDSSTIYANSASQTAGMRAIYNSGAPTATIINSTIAGNSSVARVGGLNLIIAAKIYNSTIAFNNAFNGLSGVLMSGPTLEIDSTIIANNGFNDADDFDVFGTPIISGAHNLVMVSSAALPPDTIQDDPLLGTFGGYGGPTMTIPLLDGSPAIDAGSNPLQLATDQRGDSFARKVGFAADIGAFEVQTGDVIFADGFDPPP